MTATPQCNISQHCWPSICKLWPNDNNISMQHIATLLGTTCCTHLATPSHPPSQKKSHSQDHLGFNFKKNYFGVHNLVFSWQKTALTFTVMQHEPAQCYITVSDTVHEFWNVIQCILLHKKSFFEIIHHLTSLKITIHCHVQLWHQIWSPVKKLK